MSMDQTEKVIDRVQKLLRLAANNPNEEEARSAALQAAKLIAEHKLYVGRAAPQMPVTVTMNWPPPSWQQPQWASQWAQPPQPWPDPYEPLRRAANAAANDEYLREQVAKTMKDTAEDAERWRSRWWRGSRAR